MQKDSLWLSEGVGEVTAQYANNAAGLSVSKTVDGVETRFVLDGGNVALETTTGVGVTAKYLRGVNHRR